MSRLHGNLTVTEADWALLRRLLDLGADVNAVDRRDGTILHETYRMTEENRSAAYDIIFARDNLDLFNSRTGAGHSVYGQASQGREVMFKSLWGYVERYVRDRSLVVPESEKLPPIKPEDVKKAGVNVLGLFEDCVDVYFDESGEFLMIPKARLASRDEQYRCHVEVDSPERLQWDGSSVKVLGEKVLKCLAAARSRACLDASDDPPEVWKSASGVDTWRAFAEARKMVSVRSSDKTGAMEIVYSSLGKTVRYTTASGKKIPASVAFRADYQDPPEWSVKLPLDATPEQVGEAVLQVFRAAAAPGV